MLCDAERGDKFEGSKTKRELGELGLASKTWGYFEDFQRPEEVGARILRRKGTGKPWMAIMFCCENWFSRVRVYPSTTSPELTSVRQVCVGGRGRF